jgi:hypothetical protein
MITFAAYVPAKGSWAGGFGAVNGDAGGGVGAGPTDLSQPETAMRNETRLGAIYRRMLPPAIRIHPSWF